MRSGTTPRFRENIEEFYGLVELYKDAKGTARGPSPLYLRSIASLPTFPDTRRAHKFRGVRCRPDTSRDGQGLVDYDLVGIPEPAVAESNIGRRYIPIPAVEPEAAGATAAETPHVSPAETAGKPAVRKGLIQMVVADRRGRCRDQPSFSRPRGNVGMAWIVAVIAIRLDGMRELI